MRTSRKPLLHRLHDYFFPHSRNNHRPHIFSAASIAVLAIAVIVFEAGYLVQTKLVFLRTDFLASVLPGALVALTNQDRIASGIAGVTEDPLLDQAAQAAAQDMAAKGYFAHVSPDGKSPWYWLDQAGYKYSYAGENLAVNFTDSSGVETAWMNSPTHRANIEKPQYTKIGIGVANGTYEGAETTFVVQFFAAPEAEKVAVIIPAKPSPAKQIAAATSSNVLGTETKNTDAVSASAVSVAPAVKTGWFASLLTAPLSAVETVFAILFAAIAALFVIAVLARGRFQHPSVIFGGAFLLVLVSGAMFMSAVFAGSVELPAGGQAASVYMGLAP